MNKDEKILYAGDTSLSTAGGYLAGILTHYRLRFDYLASDQPIAPALRGAGHTLYIISDYPVNNWREGDFAEVRRAVEHGAGLIMIGGWESFHGQAGEYHDSPLAELLPVEMQTGDDRVNCPQPCLIEKVSDQDHPIITGLPFNNPPGVGGYNRVTCRQDATEVLAVRHFDVSASPGGGYEFRKGASAPLLVVGEFGRGRTAAFASDVAPHWVGGFVDWGQPRVTAQAAGAGQIEVGCHYAEFFAHLVRWTMGPR